MAPDQGSGAQDVKAGMQGWDDKRPVFGLASVSAMVWGGCGCHQCATQQPSSVTWT